jgi:charged multivesicular body protein 4
MDDIREQMDLANEISEAIAQPVGFGIEFDEEELNAELEELEQEQLDEKLLDAGKVDALPSVPSTVPSGIYFDGWELIFCSCSAFADKGTRARGG